MASLYSTLAADYHLFFPAHLSQLKLLAERAGDPPARLLDAGCGSGQYVEALSAHGYEVFGVEINHDLHRMATRLHPALAHRLVHGDLLEIFDLVRGPVDLAFSIGGTLSELASLEQVRDVIAQLWDLTHPRGRLVLEVPCIEHLLREARRAQQLLVDDPGGLATLVEQPPAAGSPQSGTLIDDVLRLDFPRRSATRDDGTRVHLESFVTIAPGEAAPSYFTAQYLHSDQTEAEQAELALLALTRSQLADNLPSGAAVDWLGGYGGEPWGEEHPLTIAVVYRD
jgi:SAM-dependent methyltransferase